MDFEKYWSEFGELHASMCNGDIKQFAKEIWGSATAHNSDKTICPICGGDGLIKIMEGRLNKYLPTMIKCKECKGTGHIV